MASSRSKIVDKLLSMNKQQRRAKNPFARRKSSKREPRVRLSRKGLIRYLLDNDIRSSYKLDKERKPSDPSRNDYRREFGCWDDVRLAVWGDLGVIGSAPMDDPEYQLKVVRDWGLYSAEAYRAARKRAPDIVPSFRKVLTQWGSFSKLVEASLRMSITGNFVIFLRLYDRLGKFPTAKNCQEEHIDLQEIVKTFGSIKAIKALLALYNRYRGGKNAK